MKDAKSNYIIDFLHLLRPLIGKTYYRSHTSAYDPNSGVIYTIKYSTPLTRPGDNVMYFDKTHILKIRRLHLLEMLWEIVDDPYSLEDQA